MGFLYTKTGGVDPLFSRFFIYYFTRVMEGADPKEDSGSNIRMAMKVLSKKGAPPEGSWPYLDENFGNEPVTQAQADALDHQAILYYRCSSLRTVQASIAQGFPVVFGFSVPASMNSDATYRTGIVRYPAPGEGFIGGHAVLAIGYDDSKQQITFQNSWGKHWGDEGFGYLPYRYFSDYLVSDFWTLRKQEM